MRHGQLVIKTAKGEVKCDVDVADFPLELSFQSSTAPKEFILKHTFVHDEKGFKVQGVYKGIVLIAKGKQ